MTAEGGAAEGENEIRVSSWPELHEVLYGESWNAQLGRFRSPFVFRGQARADAKLTTTLQRLGGEIREVERHLLRNFRKYAYKSGVDRDLSWYWLAVGQHHGLPTRLLDWTSSPLVAMHFATASERQYDVDGVIWMVNFVQTNDSLPQPLQDVLRAEGADLFTVDMLAAYSRQWQREEGVPRSTFDLDWLENLEREAEQPFLLFLEPPSIDERIVQQAALFSLLSNPDTALDDWLADHPERYRRVILPAALKWEIRDKLDQSNITERTLFPGLEGLGQSLSRYYRIREGALVNPATAGAQEDPEPDQPHSDAR
ncbi:FRG domain-containing protein [Deinococcus hopiensis]|uniref:FRG domain-containing protein n=1 Tax=Deinococcus hopiensis KR-140 TaxID=695939 RepID=A0A1W1VM15_9DEIO|nr:FRG domain-containing protein [Deinococcus hopiensis]SMB94368.1 FRG domain-containing protein [Deinococcus hopiensis KR-140]